MNEFLNSVRSLVRSFFPCAAITLELTVIAIFIGVVLGLLLALGKLSKFKIINLICGFYIWLFRGTPLMLQIMFTYFGLPIIIKGLDTGMFFSGFIALGLNSAAYLAEIIRAAIQSIDKGQMEAARALGMSYAQAMRRIIIPQSYRRLIPPVGNEFISLLKDTSLVSSIGLTELMRQSVITSNSTGNAAYYLPAIIFYLAMTTVLTYIFGKLEKKYSVYE